MDAKYIPIYFLLGGTVVSWLPTLAAMPEACWLLSSPFSLLQLSLQ
jgi:hypothetical protein